MSKYHNIHNIIGCAAALVVGTQGNDAMADYGYSLDEMKAHWREKPNAIEEEFNQLWLDDEDFLLWQDSLKLLCQDSLKCRTRDLFRIENGSEVFSYDGKWGLACLPDRFGGTEAVRIYKALSRESFLTSIFGKNLANITFNQYKGCPTQIVYKPQFGKQLFNKDGERIGLEMSVSQRSDHRDINANFQFIFEKTGNIVKMVALDGTVKIGSVDENQHRTEQIGCIWMKKPHSARGASCNVHTGLSQLPAIYKELQKNFNECEERGTFHFWIEDIGNDDFKGEITSYRLLQITNQNSVRHKIISFLHVISSNKFFENVLGKQYWNDIQNNMWEKGLGGSLAEEGVKVHGKIRWSADGVNFSENVVPNPLALSVQLEIEETEVVNGNPNGVSIGRDHNRYSERKDRYRNKIHFRFVYDVRTDTIRDPELCPGELIVGDEVQLTLEGSMRVQTCVQQTQPRHVRQTVEHDFSDVNDFSDLFKFDASK